MTIIISAQDCRRLITAVCALLSLVDGHAAAKLSTPQRMPSQGIFIRQRTRAASFQPVDDTFCASSEPAAPKSIHARLRASKCTANAPYGEESDTRHDAVTGRR